MALDAFEQQQFGTAGVERVNVESNKPDFAGVC